LPTLGLLALAAAAPAATIVPNPASGALATLNAAALCTNGLAPANCTQRVNMPAQSSDTWTGPNVAAGNRQFLVTNTSNAGRAWTGFRVSHTLVGAIGAPSQVSNTIGGFGQVRNPGFANGWATLTLDARLKPVKVGDSVYLFEVVLNNNAVFLTHDYNLRVQPISVAPPAPAGQANPGNAMGAAMQFDAASGLLSFASIALTDGAAGATLSVPGFTYAGSLDDGNFIFANHGDNAITVNDGSGQLLRAEVAHLTYRSSENLLVAELYDPEFPGGAGSPWVAQMDAMVNPLDDGSARLWFSFTPTDNLLSATAGFTTSHAVLDGRSTLFAAQVVPEPASLALLAAGLALVSLRLRGPWAGGPVGGHAA